MTVSVPPVAPRAGYLIHPPLLDACLQGIAAAVPEVDPHVRLLLMEFREIRLLGDPGAGVWAHVSVTPAEGGSTSEVRLVDRDDQVLLEITGVFLRKVGRSPSRTPLREASPGRGEVRTRQRQGSASRRPAATPGHLGRTPVLCGLRTSLTVCRQYMLDVVPVC